MPANYDAYNTAVAALATQVAATEGTETSAAALITGFSAQITKAVTDALTADNAADQGSIDAATTAITEVTNRFKNSADTLGAAVASNPTT